jgi:hypothetical protein
MRTVLTLGLTMVLLPAFGVAQEPIGIGERVRLELLDGEVVTGTLQETSSEGLRVRGRRSGVREVRVNRIARVERSAGGRWDKAIVMSISVLGLGTAAAVTWDESSAASIEGLGIGMLGGIIVGGVVSLVIPGERWEAASLPQVSMHVPHGGGLDLRGSISVGH